MKKLCICLLIIFLIFGCRTVDFDSIGGASESVNPSGYDNYNRELMDNAYKLQKKIIKEQMESIQVEPTIVYVEKPVYYPIEEKDAKTDKPQLTGKDAVKASTNSAAQIPSDFKNGTMYYDFDNDFTYEIYCQPYRVTDLILEPGEQVIEMPFLSEVSVWEIGAGVSRSNGVDVQHFFIKPAYSGLETSFIIITDKRVYHFMLKSFKDCYMTQVRFKYPNTMPFTIKTEAMQEIQKSHSTVAEEPFTVDPKYLSFDYKMQYSFFKKPYWLPERVYDDGKRTYIIMDETVLHMASPVLFNHKDERINYFVDKNLLVINELIEKVTLQIGKEKVTIKKKNYKEPKQVVLTDDNLPVIPDVSVNTTPGFVDTLNSHSTQETFLHSGDVVIVPNVSVVEEKTSESTSTETQTEVEQSSNQ